ncbi:MAG TPA: hypothetical protein VFY29_10775 [Terriglobia bacterium]|nr:hypothetical protein [Terriglobia bacterium]
MKTDYFVQGQRMLSCLQNRASPPFKTIARRPFTLDLEARPAIGEQQEAGGARDQMGAGAADRLPGICGKIKLNAFRELWCAANDGREAAGPQKIVPNTVAFRKPGLSREVVSRIEQIDGAHSGSWHIESKIRQNLEEIPGAPCQHSSRFCTNVRLDFLRGNGGKDALKRKEIQGFVPESEVEMIGEGFTGPVPPVKNIPALFPANAATDILI